VSKISKIDLNGDGILDQINQARVEPQKTPGDACGGGLQFDVHPVLEGAARKLIEMPNAPKGLRRFHDGMMDFALTDPKVSVFQPGGLLSVRKGQVIGEVDASGKLVRTFTIDGLALGITQHQLDKLFRGTYEKQVEHSDLTWRAYTLSGDQVKEEISLKRAVWVVAGQPVNPNTLLTAKSLSDAETLLKPLFESVSALKGQEGKAQKLETTIAQWRVNHHALHSTHFKTLTTEPMWSEIRAALGKMIGLPPA
jgi:hypothetical protein